MFGVRVRRAIPTSAVCSCTTGSKAIRCARTIRLRQRQPRIPLEGVTCRHGSSETGPAGQPPPQHGAVPSGHARRRSGSCSSSTASASSIPRSRSAISTAASRRPARTGRTSTSCIYTDRLNYVSPLINNLGYAMTMEKMLGLEVPERAQYIRVLMSELSRVSDHLTCLAAMAMECGAFTVFLYKMKAREFLWDVIEQTTGARMTTSYIRIGGVRADLHPGLRHAVQKADRGNAEGPQGRPRPPGQKQDLPQPDPRHRLS